MTKKFARQGAYSLGFALCAVCLSPAARAVTENTIIVESVNDYSYVVGNHNKDTICNSEGDGFWNTMASATDFVQDQHYKDGQVYDTDFLDSNRSGDTHDHDNQYWDHNGHAISFVCAHGTCNARTGDLCGTCNAGEHCTALPPPPSGPNLGFCVKNVQRRIRTSSSSSFHGNVVYYGGGNAAWGEDSSSGTWAGAGSDGGTNLVVLINSCGLTAPFYSQYVSAFAGVHLVAGIMPIDQDTVNIANRGSTLASRVVSNHNEVISDSWFATMDSISGGTVCVSSAGGHGIDGCGAYYTLAYDNTTANAQYHTWTERWVDLTSSTHDATGNGGGWIYWHCNYDCNTYPW